MSQFSFPIRCALRWKSGGQACRDVSLTEVIIADGF
jgi:hypothetical protein